MTNQTEGDRAGNADNAIRPAVVELTRTIAPPPDGPVQKNTGVRHVWAALGILILIAAAVIFILPRYITPPVLTTESSIHQPAADDPVAAPAGTAVTAAAPWQAAQLARQRERSQEILARMLELQEQLEQKNVRAWAAEEYDRALKSALDGDAAYQQQQFERSLSLYNEASIAMGALLDGMDASFDRAVAEGNTALANGDAAGAEKSFQHALVIKPETEPALTGLARSKTLDQVLQLITEGNDLQQNGKLEQARSRYQQALGLDKQMEPAKQQLAAVTAKLRETEFTRLMSDGYTRLQDNDLGGAKQAFDQANRVKPGSAEVKSALAQIQGRLTNAEINSLLQNAVALEKQEKWVEAAAEYDRALVLDANLAQAQEGKRYSTSRAQLDTKLEQFITKPERLADQAVYSEALALYQQAVSINPAEPRLASQLQQLDRLLQVATMPVAVNLRSDNLTEITILRVGPQGKFTDKNLMLVPGRYTVVGTREGYRDVRVEFRVIADAPAQTVEVSATEKIAAR